MSLLLFCHSILFSPPWRSSLCPVLLAHEVFSAAAAAPRARSSQAPLARRGVIYPLPAGSVLWELSSSCWGLYLLLLR